MAFDFKRHLIKVQGGRQYLPVSARLIWFRSEHPDWGIETEAVEINHEKQYAVFRARIYNEDGKLMAMGTKKEDVKGFGDYIEKAECVPLDTRILTAEGWKTHDTLRLGELVLAYDVDKDHSEWVPLLAVRRYRNAPIVQVSNGKGFDVLCTPDHKWPICYSTVCKGKRYQYRSLREASRLTKSAAITVGAVAEGGSLPVTPQQAFLMGMLITDGSIRYTGKHIRAYICQSKPDVIAEIRMQLADVPRRESVVPAHTRTFPTGRTYDCRIGYRWEIAASYLHDLHDAFGIVHETELPNVAAHLSLEARSAFMKAMMLAEGDRKGTFAQMPGRSDWVIDLWTALCAMEGSMVCKSAVRENCGGIWAARRKKTRHVWAGSVTVTDAGNADVWCPQTPLGTWVARFSNDVVTVTGNTGAVGRALAMCGYGTQFSPELDEAGGGRFADSPQPMGGGRFGGGNGGGSQGGSNRFGNGGASSDGGARFTPPREFSAPPREDAPARPSNGREDAAARPTNNRDEAPNRPSNGREDAPARPAPAREDAPARPAAVREDASARPAADSPTRRPSPAPQAEDDDEFEALIGGAQPREVTEDDPFGEDDAPAAAAPPKAAAAASPSGMPACNNCGKALTKAQQGLSIRNFGEALCPSCQRERPRTERPAAAAR